MEKKILKITLLCYNLITLIALAANVFDVAIIFGVACIVSSMHIILAQK